MPRTTTQHAASSAFTKLWMLVVACVVAGVTAFVMVPQAHAAPPVPFEITYNARYDSFEAEAYRFLRYDAATSTYQLSTRISLELFGQTLTSVVEESQVHWEMDQPIPLSYKYVQEGLSTRSRSINFDHQEGSANYIVDSRQGTLPLNGPVYDDLSSYLAIREQLVAGNKDIMVEVLDKDTIKTYHYQVEEEALLNTALGDFTAVKLARVRDDNPKRKTEIWLAKDYDFIPLKVVQAEPNNHTIRLDITKAIIDGKTLNIN